MSFISGSREKSEQRAAMKRRRLVLFPLPAQGHINPMLELAQILYSKGFSITIIQTEFKSVNPSKYPHFTFHSLFHGFSRSDYEDIPTALLLFNTSFVEAFRECLAKLLHDAYEANELIACLISDTWFYFTQSVANSLHLPRIALRTGGLASTLAFATFPSLKDKGYLPTPGSQFNLEDVVEELPPLRVKDLPLIYSKHPCTFYDVLYSSFNEAMASSGMIFNSIEELESPELAKLRQKLSVPIFPIGPFYKYFPSGSGSGSSESLVTPDETCIPWLDKQEPNSVVYVSFGSLAAIAETEFLEVAWGLANSKHPFLWVVRPGMISGSEWLEPLPSGFMENLAGRGHIVKWAPQQQVLAHPAVGAFWTHSGWNSTMESICEGVPMICMPFFGDQFVNTRYVSHVWKIGLELEKGSSRGEIERIIRKLLEENEGKEIKERSSSLKEKAKLCLKQSGSSYRFIEDLIAHILSLESISV